jgi:hypothetical protein
MVALLNSNHNWRDNLRGQLFRLEVVATLHGSLEGEVWYHHVAARVQNPTQLKYLDTQDQYITKYVDLK